MIGKKKKIMCLSALFAFLFIGTMFSQSQYYGADITEYIGESPTDVNDLQSSFDQYYSGSDGANLGIYGYTNGTKSGYQSDSSSAWSSENDGGVDYMRALDIPFSMPSVGTWEVTELYAEISDLKATKQIVEDNDFALTGTSSLWNVGDGSIAINPGDGVTNNLIYSAGVTSITTSNNYFNGLRSAAFRVGKNNYEVTKDITNGVYSYVNNNPLSESYSGTSRSYYVRSGDEIKTCDSLPSTAPINNAALGYRRSGESYCDAYFANDGVQKSQDYFNPYSSSYQGSGNHGTGFDTSYITSGNDVTITGYLQSYGSSGGRSGDHTGSLELKLTVLWDNEVEWDAVTELEIPWEDDGSPPDTCYISYNLDPVGLFSKSYQTFDSTWTDTSRHSESGYVTVKRELINPDGAVVPGVTTTYTLTSSSVQTTVSNYNIAPYITHSESPGNYKIRFTTTVHCEATANYNDIEVDDKGFTAKDGHVDGCIEVETSIDVGVRIEDLTIKVNDDRPWDNGADYNDVYFDHDTIDFDSSSISQNDYPIIEFDWYIDEDIVGAGHFEDNTLDFGYPFAEISWTGSNHPTYSSGSVIVFDENGETIGDVYNRAASAVPQWPWLGSGTGHGSDTGGAHFYNQWDDGALYLTGADTIVISVGFRFEDEFTVDYDMSTGDNYLLISNVEFTTEASVNMDFIDFELVWDHVDGPLPQSTNWDVSNNNLGNGYLDQPSGLDYYHSTSGQKFYFRADEYTSSCSFNYEITLFIKSQDWNTVTTYSVTNGQDAEFYANFTIPLPTDSSLSNDWKTHYWFDLVFPKFIAPTSTDPYWDLVFAYEDTSSGNSNFIKYGYDDGVASALDDPANKIAVFENSTEWSSQDPTGMASNYNGLDYLNGLAQYHQFARFHNDLFDQWLSTQSELNWNVLFTAPNYISDIVLSNNTNYGTPTEIYFKDDSVNVRGNFIGNIFNSIGTRDTGDITISWYQPEGFSLLTGLGCGGSNPLDLVVSSGSSYLTSDPSSLTIGQDVLPDTEYWVGLNYYDENACGDSYTAGSYYSTGVFRLGFSSANFTVQRDSYVDSGEVSFGGLPLSDDNVPTCDTSEDHDGFPIIIKWRDGAGSNEGIEGATAKITVASWALDEVEEEKKTATNMAPWIDFDMVDLGDGNYGVWVSPEYYGYLFSDDVEDYPAYANMTQGFHNFTVEFSKDGYLPSTYEGNFSILVDTYLIIDTPQHINSEDSSYNPTGYGRPHFDDNNAFATVEYEFKAWLFENSTDNTPFSNSSTSFYGSQVKAEYQLYGFSNYSDPSQTILMDDSAVTEFINWTWFDEFYAGEENTFVNGTMEALEDGTMFVGTVEWPSFSDMADKGVPYYVPDVHIYYNLTVWIDTERTVYTEDFSFQPFDVQIQTCEDNPADSANSNENQKLSTEEIFGFQLQLQDTSNMTYLTLIDNATDNNNAFIDGTFEPHESDHEQENYEIVTYWYNSSREEFRLRVKYNCTQGADPSGLGISEQSPPAGPLNDTSILYGIDRDWCNETYITLRGWNDTIIPLTPDYDYLWECQVNGTVGEEFTAYGVTFVTPWLSYSDIPSTEGDTQYLFIDAHKDGFVDDTLTVRLIIDDQDTTLYNTTTSETTYDLEEKIYIETPTGIETSFYIQYNDTTNNQYGLNTGIKDAVISCEEDTWLQHFVNGLGTTWTYEDFNNGTYKITLLDTMRDIFTDNETFNLQMKINKGNYSAVDFNVNLTITKRDMNIFYLGGKAEGYYTPDYVVGNYVELAHINLTYQVVDLDNSSNSVGFIETVIQQNFNFKRVDTGDNLITQVTKFENSTGIYYYVILQTNIDLGGPEVDQLVFDLNFTISNVKNYYDDNFIKSVTINALPSEIEWIDGPEVEVEYLWSSYTGWTERCPIFRLNITDPTHAEYLTTPIDMDDYSSFSSTFDNTYRNGGTGDFQAINYGGDNEDIQLEINPALTESGIHYQYLEITVDTRGITVQDDMSVVIEIEKPNFETVVLNLEIDIVNASTAIPSSPFISYTINDVLDKSETPDYENLEDWEQYDSSNPNNDLELPWGMLIVFKCSYKTTTGALNLFDDGVGGAGLVDLAIMGLPAEISTTYKSYKSSADSEFYFALWGEIAEINATSISITLSLSKPNFETASISVNLTIRPRETDFLYDVETYPTEQSVMWKENVIFQFEYRDNDIVDKTQDGIINAIINGSDSLAGTSTFYFGDELQATWGFSEIGAGVYQIVINTSALDVRDEKYVFNFNITKLGSQDGLNHWDVQEFELEIFITPLILQIEHFFILPGEEDDFNSDNPRIYENSTGYATFINPELYESFKVYLKIYYEVNGLKTYLTDNTFMNVSMILYDWNDDNAGQFSSENAQTKIDFEFVKFAAHATSFKGYWVATIEIDFFNSDSDYPTEVHLNMYNVLKISIETEEENIPTATTQWSFVVNRGLNKLSPIFIAIVILFSAAAVIMGTYGVKKVFQLRIPFVLRMIDESIEKIEKDKFPEVGVMLGRSEFVINMVIDYMDMCGLEWEIQDKIETADGDVEEESSRIPPMVKEELVIELNKIQSLSADERMLFIEELIQLDRKSQIEFLKSLEEEQ